MKPATNKKKKKRVKKPSRFLEHMKSIGATNRLAIYLVGMLIIGLIMGFILAILSISSNYTGSLICFTVVFTPIGTAISIVLNSIVNKSKAENTGADGEGIKYALAMNDIYEEPEILPNNESETDSESVDISDASIESPPI